MIPSHVSGTDGEETSIMPHDAALPEKCLGGRVILHKFECRCGAKLEPLSADVDIGEEAVLVGIKTMVC